MELARAVEQSLKTKGVHTKQLKMNGAAFSKVSEDAVLYSKMSSLSDVRSRFIKKAPAPETVGMKPMKLSEAHDRESLSVGMVPPPGPSAHMSFMPSDMVRLNAAAPASMSTSSRGAEYSIETDEINTEQVYRMVSKVLNSQKTNSNLSDPCDLSIHIRNRPRPRPEFSQTVPDSPQASPTVLNRPRPSPTVLNCFYAILIFLIIFFVLFLCFLR